MIRKMIVPTKLSKELLKYRTTILTEQNVHNDSKEQLSAKQYAPCDETRKEDRFDAYKKKKCDDPSTDLEEGEIYIKDSSDEINVEEGEILKPQSDRHVLDAGNKYFLPNSAGVPYRPTVKRQKIAENKNRQNKQKTKIDHTKASNFRSQLCKFYLSNSCTKGENCTFSHDLKKFPCKAYHLKKNCTRANCLFSHNPINKTEMKKLMDEEKKTTEHFIFPF